MTKRMCVPIVVVAMVLALGRITVSAESPAAATVMPAAVAPASSPVAVPVAGGVEANASPSASAATTSVVELVKSGSVPSPATNEVAIAGEAPDVVSVNSFQGTAGKQSLISVALDDVPLQDVVRLFTKISGANIISSSTHLQGKVTVNLQDVDWKPALDSILDMYNMIVVEKVPGSGIYSVMMKAPGASDPLIAQPIFLNYAQVSNVVAVVKPMVGPEGMVSPFPNGNALVVRATAANLNTIRKVIEGIDVPRQQVYIEAKFLELSDDAIKDLGIDWTVLQGYTVGATTIGQTLTDSRSKFNGQRTGLGTVDSDQRLAGASSAGIPGSGATDSRSQSTTLSDGTENGQVSAVDSTVKQSQNYSHEAEHIAGQHLSDIRTAVLSADDFKLVLSALQQVNGVSIVSNPKIMVANEETATIHIGEMEPNIKGTVTPGQQGQANSTTYALDEKQPYFEYGISLEVTPTINNQSNVSVRISPTLSRFERNKVAPDNNTYPVTSTKTIKTTFSLESGKTAAIGGLTETDDKDQVVKIPLLGDIPLLGKFLFSHSHKQHTQTETIIFVTVGLANPRTTQREEGLPEDAELTKKHFAAKKAEKDKLAKAEKSATKPDKTP